MSDIGKPERATQNRVVKLFCDELGYRYLGDWADRAGNSNIEEGLLTEYLTSAGYSPAQISTALYRLRTEANHPDRSLYGNNQAVYQLLRYGVPVKTEAGKVTETVHLINWKAPASNHFAIAEEVTLKGKQQRRPMWCCISTASPSVCWSSKTAGSALAMASGKACQTSCPSSTPGSSAPCSW